MSDKVRVLEGSYINEVYDTSIVYVKNIREKYKDYIKSDRVIKTTSFMSPSAAADLVTGNSINGRELWVDINGKSINQISNKSKDYTDADEVIDYEDDIESNTVDLYEEFGYCASNHNNENKFYNSVKSNVGMEDEVLSSYDEESLIKFIRFYINKRLNNTIELGKDTIDKLANVLNINRLNKLELGENTLLILEELLNKYVGVRGKGEYNKGNRYVWSRIQNNKVNFEDNVYKYSFKELVKLLEIKKALLLTGVPGTGKTQIMKNLLYKLTNGDTTKYKIISFNQNTDYIDFIGGVVSENGKWVYKDGLLVEMCKRADSDSENKYYLGIDELSRGNTEAIFGELMTAIEHRDTIITLKNGDEFLVPSNLYFVATMNISDNSTKNLDIATKERFIRYNIQPAWEYDYIDWLCKGKEVSEDIRLMLYELCEIMDKINHLIVCGMSLGETKVIGTRAMSGIDLTFDNIKSAIEGHILPEVKERFEYIDNEEEYELITKLEGLLI